MSSWSVAGQWATARLSEFLVKGFTMDDARLKNPPGPGVPDYFDELLARIGSGVDRAACRCSEAQHGLDDVGRGKVRRSDVTVAKNYLREEEITELNRIVVMFLDFAEDQAQRRKQVLLRDWPTKLDEFLRFNERAVLGDAGKVRREDADEKALGEFERFEVRRRQEAELSVRRARSRRSRRSRRTCRAVLGRSGREGRRRAVVEGRDGSHRDSSRCHGCPRRRRLPFRSMANTLRSCVGSGSY